MKNVVLYLEYILSDTRKAQEENIKKRVEEAGFTFVKLRVEQGESKIEMKPTNDFPKIIKNWIKNENSGIKPIAVMRWDEHGGLFGRLNRFKILAQWCWKERIAILSVDFGYFNHYKGYMFDLLDEEGQSFIRKDWNGLENRIIEIEDIKGSIGEHIRLIQRIYKKHQCFKKLHNLVPTYRVAAFTQSLANNCVLSPKNNCPGNWCDEIKKIYRDKVIFKTQPAIFVKGKDIVHQYRTVTHGRDEIKNQGIEINASLAVNAEYVITNASGVTNEFVIAGIPCVVTGKSWFNGLNIFHEPTSWEAFARMADNIPKEVDSVQSLNRKKWMTWWLEHQTYEKEPSNALKRVVHQFYDQHEKDGLKIK